MALNKVEICGVNTASLPLLTNEEKEELFISDTRKPISKSGIQTAGTFLERKDSRFASGNQ